MIVFISTQLNSEATTSSIKARVLHQIPSLMQSQRIVSLAGNTIFTHKFNTNGDARHKAKVTHAK